MLLGSGEIRSYELGPVVHYHSLVECLPYDEAVYMLKVTGAQLKHMLQYMLREEAFHGEHTEFYQISHGIQIVWSRKEQHFSKLELNGKPLDENQLYSIALTKYHFMNVQDFLDLSLEEVKRNAFPRVLATSCRDIIEEYMMVTQHLCREIEGRLIIEE